MVKRFFLVLGLALHPLPNAADWLQIAMSVSMILGGGAIGSLVAAATGKFSGLSSVAGILVGTLVLLFLAAYRLKGQVDSLESRPRLQIISGMVGSFRQERRVVSRDQRGAREILFRVGITHTGTTSIDRVAVELESIDPPVLDGTPLSLHIMNDNPPDDQFRRKFSLDVEQTEYIDVVLKHDEDDQPLSTEIVIFHIVPGVTKHIPAQRYTVSVFVHGHNVSADRQSFVIDVDKNGVLQFERATSC